MADARILFVLAVFTVLHTTQGDCVAEYFASVGTTGHLSSINYPQDYDLSYECGSVITASSGQTIRLDFSFFDVEYNMYDCSWDGLEIRDGDNISSPLIGKYCGNSTGRGNRSTPGVIESSGSALYLYFKSDDEQTEAGYTATFEAFVIATCAIPNVEHGDVSPDDATIDEGDSYQIWCDNGYSLTGDDDMECQSDGTLTNDGTSYCVADSMEDCDWDGAWGAYKCYVGGATTSTATITVITTVAALLY